MRNFISCLHCVVSFATCDFVCPPPPRGIYMERVRNEKTVLVSPPNVRRPISEMTGQISINVNTFSLHEEVSELNIHLYWPNITQLHIQL
jgi:hypothetical protein